MSSVRCIVLGLLSFALALLAASCGDGDLCDEAIRRLRHDCGMEDAARAPGDVCSGEALAVSRCIVDHTPAACAYYYDPVAAAGNAYARCLDALPDDAGAGGG